MARYDPRYVQYIKGLQDQTVAMRGAQVGQAQAQTGLTGAQTAALLSTTGQSAANQQLLRQMLQGYMGSTKPYGRYTQRRQGGMGFGTQDILGGYRQLYRRALDDLEGLGAQEAADISRRWNNAASAGQSDLVGRGLAGTTLLPSMRMGYQERKEADLRRLQEGLQKTRLGVHGQFGGQLLKYAGDREAREMQMQIADPRFKQMLSLMQLLR